MSTSGIVALVAIALVGLASADHRLDRRPRRPQYVGLPRRLAHRRPGRQRQRDLGGVPVGGVVPRRRRDDPAGRRGRPLVPDRVHHRLPGARALRGGAPAPFRRVHGARLRRRPAELGQPAPAVHGLRADHRVALPAAPAAGRRAGPDHADRPARLERHRRRGAGRRAHRGRRRHAVDHLRAGVPVLAQAHRAGRAGRVRARPVPLRQPQPGARRRPRLPRRDDRRRAHGRRPADPRAGEPGGRRARSTGSGRTGRRRGNRAGTRSRPGPSCGSRRARRSRRSPARRPRTGHGSNRAPGTPTTRCWRSTPC